MKWTNLLVPSLLAVTVYGSRAETDWPRFRGSDGSGVAAAGAQPATTWSDTENLKWKTALPGEGTSSPILVGGKIFLTCWTDGAGGGGPSGLQRQLVCADRGTGKLLWSKSVAGEEQADRYDGFLQEHG